MTEEKEFFIFVLELMPVESVVYIQAPSLTNESIIGIWKETDYDYYKSIELTLNNKKIIIDAILHENFQEDIQSVEIRNNGNLLFEGFDGVEFGTISRSVILPEDFLIKHVSGDFCTVSDDW